MNNISIFALDKSKTYIKTAREAAQLTQRLEIKDVVSSENINGMEQYFYEQLSLHKQFASIYYANTKGEFLMVIKNNDGYMTKIILIDEDNDKQVFNKFNDKFMNLMKVKRIDNDKYNPIERPWYKLASINKKLSWTDPYVFFTSKQPGITTAIPVYNNQYNLQGVIGVDIQMEELSQFISNMKISKNSKVFMLDSSLKVIAFPKESTVHIDTKTQKARLLKLNELDDKIAVYAYNKLKEDIKTKKLKTKKFITFTANDGKVYYSLFLPFEVNNINWTIGMYVPEDDYLGLIKENQKFNLVLSLLIGFIAIIVGFLISKAISKPILRMQNMAHDLKKLNLNTPSVEPSSFEEINEAIESFNTMKISLKEAYSDTIFRLALASEYKDSDTADHIRRIGKYAGIIGKYLKLNSSQLYILENASSMHDIGKLGIEDDVLLKPGKLTVKERDIVEHHSEIGAKILENPTSDIMKAGREISMYHHEKWDGTGYPTKLKGNDIPIFARIVAIVDVFDALVSKRCYKEAFDLNKAKMIIEDGRGTHFDPACVDAFVNSFDEIKIVYLQYQEDAKKI
jgi:putative two-component system response regulator